MGKLSGIKIILLWATTFPIPRLIAPHEVGHTCKLPLAHLCFQSAMRPSVVLVCAFRKLEVTPRSVCNLWLEITFWLAEPANFICVRIRFHASHALARSAFHVYVYKVHFCLSVFVVIWTYPHPITFILNMQYFFAKICCLFYNIP